MIEPKRVLTTSYCVSETNIFVPGIKPTFPTDPEFLFVHEILDNEIGGLTTPPAVQSSLMPSVKVTNVVIHPQNTIITANLRTSEYDLAILYLEKEVAVFPATLYDGQANFNQQQAVALGWVEELRVENGTNAYYNILRKIQINISEPNNSQTHLVANNDSQSTSLTGLDTASPVYRLINNRNLMIGLYANTTLNNLRAFSNVSSMINFIKQHAPNTQFWNELSVVQTNKNIAPLLLPSLLE